MANFSLLGKLSRAKKDKVETEKKAHSAANSDLDNNISEKTNDEAVGPAAREGENIAEKSNNKASGKVARECSAIFPTSIARNEIIPHNGTNTSSRRTSQSLYPPGDERRQAQIEKLVLKGKASSQHLQRIQVREGFSKEYDDEGVIVKCYKDCFTCHPVELTEDVMGESLYRAIVHFNVKVAMTVRTPVIVAVLMRYDVGDNILIQDHRAIQVLASYDSLATCKRHHYAAFIKDLDMLIVWDDEPHHIIERASEIENALVRFTWNDGEKHPAHFDSVSAEDLGISPAELESATPRRKTLLTNATIVGLTLTCLAVFIGLGWKKLALEITVDGRYWRLFLLTFLPAQIWLSLFFMAVLVNNFTQIFWRTTHITTNSKFHSAIPPPRLDPKVGALPHITIQMPVYKEGLEAVIKPTVQSVKEALSIYEQEGGSANIFVNDDGMQLISEDEASERREFYAEHDIGWVARPAHNPNGARPFLRRGKFKKASNMNYGLMISNKIEDKLIAVERGPEWNQDLENAHYEICLNEVLAENGRAWAAGNIRMGDYILLIDSDTRIPKECLLDAASEMERDQEVGILQFSSGVMLVTDTFFEKGVKFFTELIYSAIRFTVAHGDLSPFVGHNAILRWAALQQVVYIDEDGYEKFWSESHVSEDFDMSLRLQCIGYINRLGTYFGEGFKEGVSLTVYDELSRWEKYAFGCNELIFHPLSQWLRKGPITPLFIKYILSSNPLSSKIGIMGYIGTYYAIGAAWILTLANYFLVGWLGIGGHLDLYYLDSFKIIISLFAVFTIAGNFSLAIFRYRAGERTFFGGLIENFTWLPLLTIFLGGISIHVSQALVCHFLGIDMVWGATAKEVEKNEDLWKGLGLLLKRFKWTFLFCFSAISLMVCLSRPGRLADLIRPDWEIKEFVAVFPLCTIIVGHTLLPIVLNPQLMKMHY